MNRLSLLFQILVLYWLLSQLQLCLDLSSSKCMRCDVLHVALSTHFFFLQQQCELDVSWEASSLAGAGRAIRKQSRLHLSLAVLFSDSRLTQIGSVLAVDGLSAFVVHWKVMNGINSPNDNLTDKLFNIKHPNQTLEKEWCWTQFFFFMQSVSEENRLFHTNILWALTVVNDCAQNEPLHIMIYNRLKMSTWLM